MECPIYPPPPPLHLPFHEHTASYCSMLISLGLALTNAVTVPCLSIQLCHRKKKLVFMPLSFDPFPPHFPLVPYDQSANNPIANGNKSISLLLLLLLLYYVSLTSLASVLVIKLYLSGYFSLQAWHTDKSKT